MYHTKRILIILFALAILIQVPLMGGCEKETYTVKFARNVQAYGTEDTLYYKDLESKVKSGEKVSQPNNPTRFGYDFKGWYQESACTNSWAFYTDVVTCDMTLYAKWEKRS